MAQIIMNQAASWRFGTNLAPSRPTARLNVRCKLVEYCFNCVSHFCERWHDWLSMQDFGISNTDCKSECCVRMGFCVWGINVKFGARHEREQIVGWTEKQIRHWHGIEPCLKVSTMTEGLVHGSFNGGGDINTVKYGPSHQQQSVFIHNVQSVQLPQSAVAFSVWPNCIDDLDSVWTGTSHLSVSVRFVICPVIKNREINAARGGLTGSIFNESIGDVV